MSGQKITSIIFLCFFIFTGWSSHNCYSNKIESSSSSVKSNKIYVFVFLSDTCPICQNSTLVLRELYDKYHKQGVEFVGLFPDQQTSNADIYNFRKKFNIPFSLEKDTDFKLCKRFNARVTPEVVVTSSDKNTIYYKGRIDNRYAQLGKPRLIVTSHELEDALAAVLNGRIVLQKNTEAVGCSITIK